MAAEPNRKVLIVEDSPAMRQLLALAVRRAGGEVFEADDGLAALKLIATTRFGLLFVDLNMPVMDGMKLIQRVRADRQYDGIPICVVTTEDSADTERQCRALGADHFLRKPTSRRDIDLVLARAFQT